LARTYLTFDYDKFYKALGGEAAVTQRSVREQLGSRLDITERTIAAYTQVDFSDSQDRLSGISACATFARASLRRLWRGPRRPDLLRDGVTTIVAAAGALYQKTTMAMFCRAST